MLLFYHAVIVYIRPSSDLTGNCSMKEPIVSILHKPIDTSKRFFLRVILESRVQCKLPWLDFKHPALPVQLKHHRPECNKYQCL